MTSQGRPALQLSADCGSCFGLCCAALPFQRSVDFAVDKAAGEPCTHLDASFRCGIHDRLRDEGFRGCTVFDCFGAGQQVSQVTYGGVDWRRRPESATQMYAVFAVLRQLHEILFHLQQAEGLDCGDELRVEVAALAGLLRELVDQPPVELLDLDPAVHRRTAGALLAAISARVRAGTSMAAHGGADHIGADLRDLDLRGADLRGARLIAADLSGVDLDRADLLGADLRDCNLRGASLRGSLFVAQPQVNAAYGDAATTLPEGLARPSHW